MAAWEVNYNNIISFKSTDWQSAIYTAVVFCNVVYSTKTYPAVCIDSTIHERYCQLYTLRL